MKSAIIWSTWLPSSPQFSGDSDADCYQREHLIVDASNIDKLAKARPELEIPVAEEKSQQ